MSDLLKSRILVVDDSEVNIVTLKRILSDEYTLFTTKTGKEAIEIAHDKMPNLILLDIVLPDQTGYEVINELKNSAVTQTIPVVFITKLNNVEDEIKGLMLGAADYIQKPFNDTIVKLRVRRQLQIVKQMNAIERLGMLDPLTELPNRRSIDYRLALDWKNAIRSNTDISVLMIDIDKFKHYNDYYGHLQGDNLLQMISAAFPRSFKRSSDFVGRWGGDEFISSLPYTDLNGALLVAENLRADVENAVIPCDNGAKTHITLSIGVSSIKPSKEDSLSEFLSKSDSALYSAKRAGGNRVCVL